MSDSGEGADQPHRMCAGGPSPPLSPVTPRQKSAEVKSPKLISPRPKGVENGILAPILGHKVDLFCCALPDCNGDLPSDQGPGRGKVNVKGDDKVMPLAAKAISRDVHNNKLSCTLPSVPKDGVTALQDILPSVPTEDTQQHSLPAVPCSPTHIAPMAPHQSDARNERIHVGRLPRQADIPMFPPVESAVCSDFVPSWSGEYEVKIIRGPPGPSYLGMSLDFSNGEVLLVESVAKDGAISAWNAENPARAVCKADHIVAVNGVRGRVELMVAELQCKARAREVCLRLKRHSDNTKS